MKQLIMVAFMLAASWNAAYGAGYGKFTFPSPEEQQEFFQTVCGQCHGDAAFHLGQYAADGILAAGQGGKVSIQSVAVEKIQIACLPVIQTLPQQRETAAKSFAAYDFMGFHCQYPPKKCCISSLGYVVLKDLYCQFFTLLLPVFSIQKGALRYPRDGGCRNAGNFHPEKRSWKRHG